VTVMGDEALVGRVLNDRYLIGERIARGGMASVFRATDQRLDRPVAIKVMHHGLGDDAQFTQRFVREAQSAAKLNHRNVVAVFDQGTDGEVTYLVMEYVPGRTLRDLMREEAPMPPHRALALLEQVLIALSAAHAVHMIHRDVKPENVLITPDGEVKVADFGLARAVSAATTATGGTLIGTVSYLAPEIVVNEGADARSDVYACGAMLYEMLTGVKPHAGESPIQVAYKHVHEDIGRPSEVQRGIPPYVDALVARATVRDRDQRSTDARVMLQQVRSVQRALDAGLADDPELVADLLPGARPSLEEDGTPTVLVPRLLGGAAARRGSASESAPTEAVGLAEPTVQWSAGSPTSSAAAAVPVGLHPEMSAQRYAEARASEKRSHRGRNLLLAVLVAALLATGVGYYWLNVGRYVDTPRLVGSAETAAKQDATTAGFSFEVAERRYSEQIPLGTVMSTDPAPGEQILPGDTINAVVSLGKERYYVPDDLKGRTLEDATAALEERKLAVGEVSEAFDEKVDAGRVIKAAEYGPKDALKRGTVVDLVVSKGRQPIEVRDFTGRPRDEAVAGLEGGNLKVSVDEQFNDDVKKGVVVSQSPNTGVLYRGDTVTIVVSRGPDVVTVPSTVGKTRQEATKILEKAGLKVQALGAGDFEVRSQSPAGGKARRGATVTITFVPF
jgi:beta-lactam-binding protein with PASTA domain